MPLDKLHEPIAVIGIGCRFPGSDNAQAYWQLLALGKSGIREVPPDRWDVDELYDPNQSSPGKMVTRWGGFINNMAGFDWQAFRILPREAKHMDPQHRLLLEVAWEALEDAGIPQEEVAGTRTGVFIGIMWNDYLRLQTDDLHQLNGYTTTGNANAYAPNRISYAFDMRGPSVAVDCGCASSLASVHSACQSLRTDEADMALAGGVNLVLSPDVVVMLSKAGILSPDGICKTLDAGANGFVLGEGAGIVVLKRASDVQPWERVYGFVRGSAVNHNGRNEWIMATSREAQRAVITDACNRAQVNPAEIDYVELHGSALPKGDPIEAGAIADIIGANAGHKREHPCALGSVKSNIGHLESAAGIAGFIKVALSLHHGVIPPTLNLNEVNPNIDLEKMGLSAQREAGAWPARKHAPFAGVSAISMTGSNAHVIVEGAKVTAETLENELPTYILTLSAKSEKALAEMAGVYLDFLSNETRAPLHNICYTAAVRRSHHAHRLAVLGKNIEELAKGLTEYTSRGLSAFVIDKASTEQDSGIITPEICSAIDSFVAAQEEQEMIVPAADADQVLTDAQFKALAILYARGRKVAWDMLYGKPARVVSLPTYAWQRERLWLDFLAEKGKKKTGSTVSPETSVSENDHQERERFLYELQEASPENRYERLLQYVKMNVLRVIGLDSNHQLQRHDRLFDAGLDSVTSVELANILRTDLAFPLSSTVIFNYPTLDSLSKYLVTELFKAKPEKLGGNGSADSDRTRVTKADVEEMSEEDAEALLLKRLMNSSQRTQDEQS